LDGKLQEVCECSKGKYDVNKIKGYYAFNLEKKDTKALNDVSKDCQEFDYRMKPKVN
jgi:hypothetical protein